MRAVILAGGKGTRLKPYTMAIPKPLVPLADDTPILSVLINQLQREGFDHITLAVSHMADIIKSYVGDGSRWGVRIDYSTEKTPLHTIGALTVIPDLPEHFLVVNGDTLTDMRYGDFLKEHIVRDNDISVSVKKRDVKIDFGVLTFNAQQYLTDFQEKPTHESYVAMGVNCFSLRHIKRIPRGQWYGFDDLMQSSLKNHQNVWVYPHTGFWLDIGRPEDYQYAVENYGEIQKLIIEARKNAPKEGKATRERKRHTPLRKSSRTA